MIQSKLRLLQTSDLASAIELSRVAGWNQTVEDWQTVLELDPESCFAIEVDNRIAATTTLLCYGTRLDWNGADQAGIPTNGFRSTACGNCFGTGGRTEN